MQEGDPLELMRANAREHIEAMDKNKALTDNEKKEFKKYVLAKLDENIKKFAKIDTDTAAKKAEEESKKANETDAAGEEKAAEEDPFADIFKEETPDETLQEKQKIAGEFMLDIKTHRETYLKSCLKKHEQMEKKSDEKQLDNILDQLHQI